MTVAPVPATILLTGFEPFGGDATNPSGDAVRAVERDWDEPERLVTAILPVAFAGAAERLRELIARHRPDVVLCTGLSAGRDAIAVERVAVNLLDARIPDNDGEQPIDAPSVAGAPNALFATVPVKAMAAAVRDAGIAATVSLSAGSYVCNHVMFTALDAAPAATRAGFVHVPADLELSPGMPTMPVADIARGIAAAAVAALRTRTDLHTVEGRVS